MLLNLIVGLKEPRAAIQQAARRAHIRNVDQQCMLIDAGGDFREVGKHGEVVELCSCMESVHVGAVVHCLLQHCAHGLHSRDVGLSISVYLQQLAPDMDISSP
jgi:hypothetical protein